MSWHVSSLSRKKQLNVGGPSSHVITPLPLRHEGCSQSCVPRQRYVDVTRTQRAVLTCSNVFIIQNKSSTNTLSVTFACFAIKVLSTLVAFFNSSCVFFLRKYCLRYSRHFVPFFYQTVVDFGHGVVDLRSKVGRSTEKWYVELICHYKLRFSMQVTLYALKYQIH